MADEDVGKAVFFLQVAQEFDDFHLNGAVKRRGGFVQQHEFRLKDDRAGDGDALSLPAGEFVRVAVYHRRRQRHFFEHGRDFVGALLPRELRLVHQEAFADDFADGQAWRERAVGILKDDLHVGFEFLPRFFVDFGEILAFKVDVAAIRQHVHQRFAEGGFAGAGFADDTDGLPLVQGEVDAFDGVEGFARFAEEAALDDEFDVHVFGVNQDAGAFGLRFFQPFRRSVDEFDGVFVLRVGKDLFDAAFFDDLAVAHDADVFGVVFGKAEVVGDEDNRHAHLPLQVVQQVKDFRLDGDVQRGGRFIGDEQVGFVDERHGNHDAL